MGLFGVLGIARDGILAQTAALTTTSSNVANVATPGYAKRTALLETASSGGGVRFARVERSFDRFSFAHVVMEQAKLGAASSRSSALADIESRLVPPSGSIGDAATAMAKAFTALAGFPTDPSLRADVLARAQNLAEKLSSTQASLGAKSDELLGQARDVVTDLNTKLAHIADLNRQIATAVGTGGDASALRDQRDVAIQAVGERIGVRAIEDQTGRVTLFAAGTALVEGDRAAALSIDLDPQAGSMRFHVTGAVQTEITSRVSEGTLGGLREARDVDLAKLRGDVDAFAFDVANAFNAVHATGFGLDGATGRPLFTPPASKDGAAASMALNPDLVGRPDRVAAAGSAGDLPGGNATVLTLGGLAQTPAFGGATLVDRFAAIATDVGFRKASADGDAELRTNTLAVAQSLSDGASGVSIDEEMVDLTRYQRAFEASSRVLRIADELLDGLLKSF